MQPIKVLGFIKKNWVGIVFLIFIIIGLTFEQFYDVQLIIIKKNPQKNISQSDLSNQPNLSQPEFGNKINPEDLKVDLENLTEEETSAVAAYLKFKKIKSVFFPSGVPELYGQELNISFDQVQDAINKVASLDPTYGQKKITLTGDDLKRYIDVGSKIACEFCCGAKTLVDDKGNAACGCDHSQMMRGLAAYLILNHPELSDEQILKELNAWKITYFPKQTLSAKLQEMEKAGESGIKELLEEFPEFLPQMVGGC